MTAHPKGRDQFDGLEEDLGAHAEGLRGTTGRADQTPASDAPPDWLGLLVRGAMTKRRPSRRLALAVLRSRHSELLDVVAAAARVRRAFFGNRVKLNYLVNMKSGLCPEDCSYCSQRRGSQAGVLKYNWVSPEEAAGEAERAASRGARRICLVASGRGPSERDLERVAEAVRAIRSCRPGLEILYVPRAARRRTGGGIEGGGRRRLQPQPQHGRHFL